MSLATLTKLTTRTTETGSRDDHPHLGRPLAPGVPRLPGNSPATAEIA